MELASVRGWEKIDVWLAERGDLNPRDLEGSMSRNGLRKCNTSGCLLCCDLVLLLDDVLLEALHKRD